MEHIPIMTAEILEMFALKTEQTVVDGTVGLGGHSKLFLEKIGKEGKLFCFDWDQKHLALAQENICKDTRFCTPTFICTDYAQIGEYLVEKVDAILLDIGICNAHLQASERGFSFKDLTAPLDCRMRSDAKTTAAEILNTRSESSLADIFYHFGEIHSSRRLAAAIRKRRRAHPFMISQDLLDTIEAEFKSQKLAAQVWQALRIAVNGELDSLQAALPKAAELLKTNGKLAVITFHSLEDRIVKNIFRQLEKTGEYKRINKKVIRPSDEEVKENPKSRSAKLRGLVRIKELL